MIRTRSASPARAALLALALAACSTAPVAPLPAPLPEAGAWELPAGDDGAFLGLRVEANEAGTLAALQSGPGVRVLRVVENSPAARQGLRAGDVLLAVDGTPLADPESLDVLLAGASAGDELELRVRRGDGVFTCRVVLAGGGGGPLTAPELLHVLDPARTRAGWRTTPDGVRLEAVAPDSPLTRADVPAGSLVTALDGERVLSARDLVRRVQARPAGARVRLALRLPDGERAERSLRLFDVPRRVTRSGVPVLWSYRAEADGSSVDLHVFDLWFLELFQYRRRGTEREWVLLELFGWELFPWGTGTGELRE